MVLPTQPTTNRNKPKTESIMEVLSADMTGQLDIFWHYCDVFLMDGTQVRVFQEAGQIVFCHFLQHHDHAHLEAQVISSAFLGYFMNEMWEGAFADKELGTHLVLADLRESHCSLTVPPGFLQPSFSSGIPCRGLPPTLACLSMSPPPLPSAQAVGLVMTQVTSLLPPTSVFSSSACPVKGYPHLGSLPPSPLSVTFILTILELESDQSEIVEGFFEVASHLLILRSTGNPFWNWHIFLGKWQRKRGSDYAHLGEGRQGVSESHEGTGSY